MKSILRTGICSLSMIVIASACAPQQRKASPRSAIVKGTTPTNTNGANGANGANGTNGGAPNILSDMSPVSNGVIAAKAQLPTTDQGQGAIKVEVKNAKTNAQSITTANVDAQGNITVGGQSAGSIKCSDDSAPSLASCANAAGTIMVPGSDGTSQTLAVKVTRRTDLPVTYKVLVPDSTGKYSAVGTDGEVLGTATDVITTLSSGQNVSSTEDVVMKAHGNPGTGTPDISDVKLDKTQNSLVKVTVYGVPGTDAQGNSLSAPQTKSTKSFDPTLGLSNQSTVSYNYLTTAENGKTLERVVFYVDKTPSTFDPTKLGNGQGGTQPISLPPPPATTTTGGAAAAAAVVNTNNGATNSTVVVDPTKATGPTATNVVADPATVTAPVSGPITTNDGTTGSTAVVDPTKMAAPAASNVGGTTNTTPVIDPTKAAAVQKTNNTKVAAPGATTTNPDTAKKAPATSTTKAISKNTSTTKDASDIQLVDLDDYGDDGS